MKSLFLISLLVAQVVLSWAKMKSINPQNKISCTLNILQLKKKKGILWIGFYNQALGFRDASKAIYYQKVSVENKSSIEVGFHNILPGKYAIAVFLDENGDGKINFNLLGIPKEKYGFSNNYFPMFRPASFEEASFELKDSMVIPIRIQ